MTERLDELRAAHRTAGQAPLPVVEQPVVTLLREPRFDPATLRYAVRRATAAFRGFGPGFIARAAAPRQPPSSPTPPDRRTSAGRSGTINSEQARFGSGSEPHG